MKIAKYIGDLLYDYECVVIPGLGGFLANDKPASIQPNTHHFRPPYKQVMFNAYLKTNDGLLVNYIAREENISYKEAKAQVDKFVYLCNNALKAGKRIHFHKVGTIFLNKNEKIVFEQDHSVNYNADAFGLTGFVSPAIRRSTPEEKLRRAVTGHAQEKRNPPKKESAKPNRKTILPQTAGSGERKHAKLVASRKKSPYRTQLTFLVMLVIAMLIGWGFMNKDMVNAYYQNYASAIPLFYTQPNAYVISNIDKVPISRVSSSRFGSWWIHLFEKSEAPVPETISKTTQAGKSIAPAGAKKPETKPAAPVSKKPAPAVKKAENTATTAVKPAGDKATAMPEKAYKPASHNTATPKPVPAANPNISSHRYYIIAGAFKSPHNVRSLIYSLKKKGYNAMAVGVTPNGFHRVAFGVYGSRRQAEQQLQKIRRKDNPAAWILVN